jgi:endonuclease/exonuclease/phosphatase family metal-dependent hydrolase
VRAVITIWGIVALVSGVALAATAQERPSGGTRRPLIVAELSDLLFHSPLVPCASGPARDASPPARARIATWNIRAARSAPVPALAAEMQAIQADVIALQEVDVRTRRGGFVDEPSTLAAALGFHHAFAASIKWDEGDYGLAVLSRWPLTEVRRHRIDTSEPGEPRIVLEVGVCANGRPLRLFNHHADRRVAARQAGLAVVRTIVKAGIGSGIVVLGDFNEPSDAPGVRGLVEAGLVDLGAERNERSGGGGRIDYLLADRALAQRLSPARAWPTDKSDHSAVWADLEW